MHTIMMIGCSNGTPKTSSALQPVCDILEKKYNTQAILHPSLYATANGETQSPEVRAAGLMEAFLDPQIDAVMDVSGGDAANGVLPFVDFDTIAQHPKPFFGYSDLSVLLNPLVQIAHIPVYYFQVRFLTDAVAEHGFSAAWHGQMDNLRPKQYAFLQGQHLEGQIVGGNIRCTLKLIGTPWEPDFHHHILFLESLSGDLLRMESMLYQYAQIGAFSACAGVLLGNFSELAKNNLLPKLYRKITDIVQNPSLPIVCTTEIGHQTDSLCFPYHVTLHLDA